MLSIRSRDLNSHLVSSWVVIHICILSEVLLFFSLFVRKSLGGFIDRVSSWTSQCENACKLELPDLIRIHRVQPVSHLDPVADSHLFECRIAPHLLEEVDCEEEYQESSAEDSGMYHI